MKAILLGDSIRLLGYGKRTAELLKGELEVWQPDDNCRFGQYLLRGLFDWRNDIQNSDIVHFNVGLWDICKILPDGEPFTPLDEYVACVTRIVRTLKAYGVKKILFSTTTPCRPENVFNKNENIEKYNAAIVPVLEGLGVEIIDLCALISDDIQGNISDDLIHLTDKGIELAAREISERIRRAAKELEKQ